MMKSGNKLTGTLNQIQSRYAKNKKLIVILCFLLAALLPLTIVRTSYALGVATKMVIYAIAASGLNIINGYSGQTNLGMAAFLGIGAYTAGILWLRLGVPTLPSFVLGVLMAGLMGFILSLPTLRLYGTYLTILTLGFSEVIRMIFINWVPVTNGVMGITNVDNLNLFGFVIPTGTKQYYWFTLVFLAVVLFVLYRLLNSRIGRAWLSIREGEDAAVSLGVEIAKYKSLNFVVGAMIGGLAGCLNLFYYRQISPDMYILDEGFNILTMTIVGGSGTLVGPIVGSVFVIFLTELLRAASRYRLVFFAILIIGTMWINPAGIAGAKNSSASQYSLHIFQRKGANRDAKSNP